ncbi:SDR family NAD(P)-dependent oxidoreductase [candidate division KSB3 bacterium]|uniref:SDR family NAD(P)-dependent oxidoreductase n=1 Tax=candidate division KSB3 bacterium TaxID=2044937 RepID=A0A9D5JZG6_9BACT|nr:SDR family NAD(P)-dependent oxidoreductase [candidate division KSB3 bacterium]MBD3327010.1 SDR family NAD(P)-dependent oxidoreductase [candidate division KSB3 bacterium]
MERYALKDKVALVTGASRGIGKAIALALAAEGTHVVVTARSQGKLEQVQQEIEAAGGTAHPVVADLSLPYSPQHIVEQTITTCGRLDILVNNAGFGVEGPLLETSLEDWERVMAVNARAPFLLCKEAVPHIKAAGGGTIIQIVSVIGVKGYVNQGAYTASKHALMGMSKVLAQEVQADDIRVHTILPGGVATEMISELRPDLDPADLMQPEELAEIVLFVLTHRGQAVIDDIHVRRASSKPWF